MNEPTEHETSLENENLNSESPATDDKTQKRKTPDRDPNRKTGRNKGGLFIVILLFLGLIIFSRHEPVNTIDCTPDIIASNPDVIMLGAWWCSYCYQAKKYFQRNNIHYCEYDMESTSIGKQMYEENGGGAIPVLLIGKYRLKGFSEQQIDRALSLLGDIQASD